MSSDRNDTQFPGADLAERVCTMHRIADERDRLAALRSATGRPGLRTDRSYIELMQRRLDLLRDAERAQEVDESDVLALAGETMGWIEDRMAMRSRA